MGTVGQAIQAFSLLKLLLHYFLDKNLYGDKMST
jgi:hypothetical protein